MKRFFIFPVGLSLIFLQWRAVAVAEFLFILWPDYSARNPRETFYDAYLSLLFNLDEPKTLITQAVLSATVGGLLWASFDFYRHRQDSRNAARFLVHLSWCWLYMTLFIALNGALVFGVLTLYARSNQRAPFAFIIIAVVLCMGGNAVASVVAICGTVANSPFPTPRFVVAEFRKTLRPF